MEKSWICTRLRATYDKNTKINTKTHYKKTPKTPQKPKQIDKTPHQKKLKDWKRMEYYNVGVINNWVINVVIIKHDNPSTQIALDT